MSSKKGEIARCGACRFYTHIGRRGGNCSQLGVPVQSAWQTCCLAESPFQQLPHVSHSDLEHSEVEFTKIAAEKKLAPAPLPISSSRFSSIDHSLAKLSQ